MRPLLAAFLLLAGACGREASADTHADPCDPSALGLKNVKRAGFWKPPTGCTENPGARDTTIQSEAEFHKRFNCPATASGVNFAHDELHGESRSLPPAGAGWDTYYDDKTLYVVSRQRAPCPKDPRPMPMNVTVWYVLPPGAARERKNMACTVPSTCQS